MTISVAYLSDGSIRAEKDGVVSCLPLGIFLESDARVPQWIKDWLASGNSVAEYSLPSPTINDVIAERSRRLTLGFDYDFGDARRVHHIGTTDDDMKGWDEVSKATQAMIALGLGSQTLTIVTNTGPATVTANEWQQILVAATAARQPIWAGSFALQSMNPIPANYADDSYWS